MRRYLLLCAVVHGLFLQSAMVASTSVSRAGVRHSARHHHVNGARMASPHAAARARHVHARTTTHLHPTQPVTTALIDPVPRGKFPFPPPLKGNRDSLVRQNVRSEKDGLQRVQDDNDLLALRRDKQLVAVPATAELLVDERLPGNRRFCRPWTAQFLSDLSRVHYGRFRRPLQVNSAVRTVEYQRHLELVNGNAAPAEGDNASPHLTGGTIDIAKKGLSTAEIGWMRAYLMPLQTAGKIDVEEEFYQSCFHISVYRSYHPAAPLTQQTPRAGSSPSLLAATMR
jgi:hypothetical protein